MSKEKNLPIKIQLDMGNFIKEEVDKMQEVGIIETVTEWAEKNRYIGAGLTARPGLMDYSANPFMKEVVDNMSDSSPILETHILKPTQVGYTVACIESYIGYAINHGIGPVTLVNGDETMGKAQMSLRIDEMISSSNLQDKIRVNSSKKKKKGTGDTQDVKQYAGTFLRSIGPNSESKAASLPARILILDEIDKYKTQLAAAGGHVDIIEKLIRRQDSYGVLKKLLTGSTPKSASTSRIEPFVESGDKRYYNIVCKDCKKHHPLLWKNLKWLKKEDGKIDYKSEMIDGVEVIIENNIWHECPHCGYKLREKDKHEVLKEENGAKWIPTKKSDKPFVRSYVLNGLYGFRSFLEIVQQWDEVKNDNLKLPDFINDVLGETWKESDQKPDDNELMLISKEYEQWPRGHIKNEVIFLVLAADIQKDRIECGLVGMGYEKQMYFIEYWTFEGNTRNIEDKCWKELDMKIKQTYLRDDGKEMNIQYAGIDSQYFSSTVDLFCSQFHYDENQMSGVFPLQARETMDKKVKMFKSSIKTPVLGIADQDFKKAIYNMLKKRPYSIGQFPVFYLHISEEFGSEFYKQLTAEEIQIIKVNNIVKGYKILNIHQRRNEVLDILKYAMALFEFSEDRYFESLNNYMKLQKQKPIQRDFSLFITHMEEQLF